MTSAKAAKWPAQGESLRGSGLIIGIALALTTAACGGATRGIYYGTMERFGQQKRHILHNRVENGRDSQREAQEQFQTTYDRFKALTGYSGDDLESVYKRLNSEYESSEERAVEVRERIASIERVAADLFAEWRDEIDQIGSADLRRNSERKLRDTETRYGQLIRAMQNAEAKMDPVLGAFRDQVLYLKHNLNAAAIASLEQNVVQIEDDVAELIEDIQRSIREADSFLATVDA